MCLKITVKTLCFLFQKEESFMNAKGNFVKFVVEIIAAAIIAIVGGWMIWQLFTALNLLH